MTKYQNLIYMPQLKNSLSCLQISGDDNLLINHFVALSILELLFRKHVKSKPHLNLDLVTNLHLHPTIIDNPHKF